MTADPATLQKDAERPNAERLAVLSALLKHLRGIHAAQWKPSAQAQIDVLTHAVILLLEAKIMEAENDA